MQAMKTNNRKHRKERGSAIIEAGPALFLALCVFFFPMLDFVGMMMAYGDCLYLSDLVLRRAAVESDLLILDQSSNPATVKVNPTPATLNADIAQVVSQWSNGFGKFASTPTAPTAAATPDASASTTTQYPGQTTPWPVTWYLNTTVRCECRPIVYIPFFFNVPGLSAPMTFQFSGRTMIENIPHPVS